MSPNADEVYRAGLELDLDERTLVAHRLLESLHESPGHDAEVADAWHAEISRRVDDVLEAKVGLVDADETYRLLSAKLRAHAE